MKKYNFPVMAIIAFASLWITSCQDDEIASPASFSDQALQDRGSASAELSYVTATIYGRPTKEFTKDWWKYVVSFNRSQNPLNQAQVLAAKSGQIGPIHCLVGSKEGVAYRNIETSAAKTLLVPVVSTVKTFPTTDASFKPARGETIEHLLKSAATKEMDQVSDMRATLDGKEISITAANRLTTNLFSFTGNRDLVNFLDLGVTGKPQAAVSDGYWLTLNNISKGTHILRVKAEIEEKGIFTDVIYTISVR